MRTITSKKLDVRIADFDDVDTGPSHSRKHDVERGWFWDENCNNRGKYYQNYRYIEKFLQSRIGMLANDAHSYLISKYRSNSRFDFRMRDNINREFIGNYPSYYIDHKGKLQEIPPRYPRWVHPKKPVDIVHWFGGWWFIREDHYVQHPACGCMPHVFRNRDKNWSYNSKATCAHGNQKVAKESWILREYGQHDPNSVYEKYISGGYGAWEYNLQPGEVKIIYYRDVPDKIQYTKHTKTPNKRELKVLRALLAGDVTASEQTEVQAHIRPLNRRKDNKPRKRLRADKNYPQDFSCSNPRW